MSAYYNENDSFAAAWLRTLIAEKVIADGEVDERSIEEVWPEDVSGFTQCHFFAGIGVWSYASRLAGWPDDRPVWTGSCPCPSFSAAGQGKGFDDPRHLWPAWIRLIRKRKPATIFGEQVDDAIGHGWLDLVQTDLEREAYAVGKAVFGACSVGAPHIRQRLYFVGVSNGAGSQSRRSASAPYRYGNPVVAASGDGVGQADAKHAKRGPEYKEDCDSWLPRFTREPRSTGGFWDDAEWLYCTDGKYRPTKPGIFPLAYGIANRVGTLRGAGNAIVAPQAEAFIRAYMEVEA